MKKDSVEGGDNQKCFDLMLSAGRRLASYCDALGYDDDDIVLLSEIAKVAGIRQDDMFSSEGIRESRFRYIVKCDVRIMFRWLCKKAYTLNPLDFPDYITWNICINRRNASLSSGCFTIDIDIDTPVALSLEKVLYLSSEIAKSQFGPHTNVYNLKIHTE